uniref:Ig-like domain-containing protein n=1 Tax=Callorhinchus milii TaxID=7868 RepID=A0A4W3JJ35_CALMI
IRPQKIQLLHLIIIITFAFDRAPYHTVYGVAGGSVTLKCQYSNIYANQKKYWCKGGRWWICTVMDQRALITDDPNSGAFSITMDELTLEDTGSYWCGITQKGRDLMLRVELQVIDGPHLLSGPQMVLGLPGESVTVECQYDVHYRSHEKYWCKGLEQESCVILARIDGLQEEHISRKLFLTDNQTSGVFSVTMNELLMEDAGRYWLKSCKLYQINQSMYACVCILCVSQGEANRNVRRLEDVIRRYIKNARIIIILINCTLFLYFSLSYGVSTTLLVPLIVGSIVVVLVITIFIIRYEKQSVACK